MRESRRLPESELDIMLVVWKEGGAATAPAILTGLERPLTCLLYTSPSPRDCS